MSSWTSTGKPNWTKEPSSPPRQTAPEKSNFVLQFAFMVLFLVAMAANAMAFYTVLNGPWMTKLEPILSMGGLLTIGPIEWLLRIVFAIAIGWHLLTHRGSRNWIEWLGLALGGMAVIAGWSALVANVALVASLAVWIIFQYVQYLSIQPKAHPGLRTIAIGLYIAEFAFQCIATPITGEPPYELFARFITGTMQWESIYWGLLLVNIACMAGVEWLAQLYMLCLKGVRHA